MRLITGAGTVWSREVVAEAHRQAPTATTDGKTKVKNYCQAQRQAPGPKSQLLSSE